jgi:hypothetical protein
MRAAEYDNSDILHSEVVVLNAASALYHGEFRRVRRNGAEINRLA